MPADYRGVGHYEILGLEPRFVVNPVEVDKAYKDLQRKLHPDRHAQADDRQKELVDIHAARVNQAVSVLRSPLLRAGFWMEMNGLRVLEEDQRMGDAATMMEVMDVNEEIEDAKTEDDIQGLVKTNLAKMADIEKQLESCFKEKDWETARRHLERLQMLTRIQERLDSWSGPQ